MAIGDIGTGYIDTLTVLSPTGCAVVSGDIAHVRDNWFAVVYHEDSTTDTTLATFEVDNCGNIDACLTDTEVVDTGGSGARPRTTMVKVTTGIVAVGYGTTSGPFIKTFSIDACGTITAVDSQDMGIASPVEVWIQRTKHANVFGVVWNPSGDLDLATVTIDACGNISTVVDTQTLNDAGNGPDRVYGIPGLVWTGVGDFHAVTGEETVSSDGFVVTFTIDSCGNIGCIQDRLEWNATLGEQSSIQSNDDGVLIIAGEMVVSASGRIKIVTVDACGDLTTGANPTAVNTTASGDRRTNLLRIDEENKNIFLTMSHSFFATFSVDECQDVNIIDQLDIGLGEYYHGMVYLPGSDFVIVGAGYKIGTGDFIVWTLDVATNIEAAQENNMFSGMTSKLLTVFDG